VPFLSLTGLKSIIAEWLNVREQSKKVSRQYDELLLKFGSEFTILIDVPVEDLVKYDPVLAEGIDNLRKGMVRLEGGYDGVFGSVNVFNKEGA
jgi:PHP family Zn ribbon phosphoesterase